MKIASIEFTPIGYVRSPEKKSRMGSFRNVEADIVIRDDLVEALEGLDAFSHLEVIFFMHISEPGKSWRVKVHPMGLSRIPAVGLFATRSPNRPNRIGLSLCELLCVEGNTIRTRGLDALDGSPVLDIKAPWRNRYLEQSPMRFPEWTEEAIRLREQMEK